MWVGPSLLYSTATSVLVLGWDGIARPLVTIGTPNAALVGALNDRLLLACANDPNPRQKQGVEIKTRLVGLLEPLLVGWTTMQRVFEPKLDLLEIMYQLTSRFDSLRVTPRSLDALAIGPPVCAELAVELAQAGPQFTQVNIYRRGFSVICVQNSVLFILLALSASGVIYQFAIYQGLCTLLQ
jgi:hypothetical protein